MISSNRLTKRERFDFWVRGITDSGVFQVSAFFLGFFLVTALLFGAANYLISKPECEANTAHIGYPHNWSFWGGCQIEVTPGQWIPLDNYQYIDGVTK